MSYRFTVYLLCHKKRSLIRSKRNEQGSKQTYLILLFSAPFSTQPERKSTSPVAMDFAFRQGKPRWEYFVYLRELQRCLSGKARHPWLWILRSGKANPDGNTFCISEGFNVARTGKHVTRGDGSCVQARQAPAGILCVFPRGLMPHERKSRSPVAMDFSFRQGEARREYFVYFRELQRCLGGKDTSR